MTFEPALAQHPTVPGPTPPSTWMSILGKRVRSSATLGAHEAMNFWPPLPVVHAREVSLRVEKKEGKRRAGHDGHDEKHVDRISEGVGDGGRGSVGRDGDGSAHAGRVNELNNLVRLFCCRLRRIVE